MRKSSVQTLIDQGLDVINIQKDVEDRIVHTENKVKTFRGFDDMYTPRNPNCLEGVNLEEHTVLNSVSLLEDRGVILVYGTEDNVSIELLVDDSPVYMYTCGNIDREVRHSIILLKGIYQTKLDSEESWRKKSCY